MRFASIGQYMSTALHSVHYRTYVHWARRLTSIIYIIGYDMMNLMGKFVVVVCSCSAEVRTSQKVATWRKCARQFSVGDISSTICIYCGWGRTTGYTVFSISMRAFLHNFGALWIDSLLWCMQPSIDMNIKMYIYSRHGHISITDRLMTSADTNNNSIFPRIDLIGRMCCNQLQMMCWQPTIQSNTKQQQLFNAEINCVKSSHSPQSIDCLNVEIRTASISNAHNHSHWHRWCQPQCSISLPCILSFNAI